MKWNKTEREKCDLRPRGGEGGNNIIHNIIPLHLTLVLITAQAAATDPCRPRLKETLASCRGADGLTAAVATWQKSSVPLLFLHSEELKVEALGEGTGKADEKELKQPSGVFSLPRSCFCGDAATLRCSLCFSWQSGAGLHTVECSVGEGRGGERGGHWGTFVKWIKMCQDFGTTGNNKLYIIKKWD